VKAIAKKDGVAGAELHRFRKTYADTLQEEGVSVNTIRIRLGHESLDVTIAYVKGKDAESEEAQEHAKQQQPGAVRIISLRKPKLTAGDLLPTTPAKPVIQKELWRHWSIVKCCGFRERTRLDVAHGRLAEEAFVFAAELARALVPEPEMPRKRHPVHR
jgi:hypothetical protein